MVAAVARNPEERGPGYYEDGQYGIRIEPAMIIDFQIWMAAFTLCAVVCMILTRENTVDILRGNDSKSKTLTGGNDPGRLRSRATRRGQ